MKRAILVNAFSMMVVVLLSGSDGLSCLEAGKAPIPNVSSRALSVLREIEARQGEERTMPQWTESIHGARVDETGRLELMIQTTQISPEALKALEDRGSSIEIFDPAQNLVQAWVPTDRMREVAALPFVKFLDLPNYGITNRPSK